MLADTLGGLLATSIFFALGKARGLDRAFQARTT